MRLAALLASVALLVPAGTFAQQPGPTGLLIGSRVDEYFGESYTTRSPYGFVFFVGDSIAFRLVVRNMGATERQIAFATANPLQLFHVEGFKAPPRPANAGERRFSGNRYDDEIDINVPVEFSSPVKVSPVGRSDVPSETSLASGETIEWIVTVPSSTLEPGLYRFTVKLNAAQQGQSSPPGFGDLRFELRANDAEAQPERVRRDAFRRLFRDDYKGARQSVAELRTLHPNSYIAHTILGMIAEREGNPADAATHRSNADAILRGGRDELLMKYTPKDQLQQLMRSGAGAVH